MGYPRKWDHDIALRQEYEDTDDYNPGFNKLLARKNQKESNKMDAQSIANMLRSDLENCMYDLAGGDEILADDYWNDPAVLGDLLGDRIFDACNCLRTDDDKIKAWEVADHIMKISHTALEDAAINFKERQGFI